jgi:hypothetical protein
MLVNPLSVMNATVTPHRHQYGQQTEIVTVDGVTVEKLTRRDRAALGYEVDLTHEEVSEFETAVTSKMIRVGYEKVTRPELYLKVREALAAYKKEQAVRAAVGAFHKVNPTKAGVEEQS